MPVPCPPCGRQVAVENYTEWISLVAEATVSALRNWAWAGSSVFYLLGLWGRLVSSMPYLKGDQPSLLETNVPQITQAYVTSRLESVQQDAGGASDMDLLDQVHAGARMLWFPFIARDACETRQAKHVNRVGRMQLHGGAGHLRRAWPRRVQDTAGRRAGAIWGHRDSAPPSCTRSAVACAGVCGRCMCLANGAKPFATCHVGAWTHVVLPVVPPSAPCLKALAACLVACRRMR